MFEHKLKAAFDPFYEAPLETWRNFAELCEEVKFKKNEKIKEVDTTARYGYFLLEGAVGTFVWKKNNYVCLSLFIDAGFFGDDLSLTTGAPTPIEIRALEDTSLLQISRENIEVLKSRPIGRTLFMVGEQNDNAQRQSHQIDLMTKSAEERYLDILHQQPDLLDRIPQKHIASYLGITTQSLSRIRRKIK